MNDLVRKLSECDHPVEATVRPERTVEGLKSAIDRGYVHVRFTDTRGGTEVGFKLDAELSDLSSGNFEQGNGQIKLCGLLTLNYERVRCVAEIDLSTMAGKGRLEPLLA